MTVIRDIRISNFRGIQYLQWFPSAGINCLIGPGDGGKSTVLDAIELTIGSKRNVTFTDADFHRCNVSEPIVIDVTLGDLDAPLRNLESYGHFLRGWNTIDGSYQDETSALLETVLTVRLTVRDDLEPQWLLFCEGAAAEGRERNLNWKDRQSLAPTRLGTVAAHHMALGPRSILGKISESKTEASSALAAASRQARKTFAEEGCHGVDDVLATSTKIASDMGIPVDVLLALLDVQGATFSGGAIALHDGDHVPLRNLGSGSMRLLVAGLQNSVGKSSISIIDEIEFGLEPYRILRLLDALGCKSRSSSQQVFMTSHSPIVLRELSAGQLHTVRSQRTIIPAVEFGGIETTPAKKVTQNRVFSLGNGVETQKTLRACSEAFLAPNVIICEGKTEIGVIRGLDLFGQDKDQRSIIAHGCHWADGNGSSMIDRAKTFARMGYRTSLFMDSDVIHPETTFEELGSLGVTVFRWADGLSTEAAIFAAVPSEGIPLLLDIACDWKTPESIDAKIRHASADRYTLAYCKQNFAEDMREILGRCSGDGKWFKDIEPSMRALREVIAPRWAQTGAQFTQPLNDLWGWITASHTFQPLSATTHSA